MTVPAKYAQHYLPVKYFLNSYRALSDGRTAVALLQKQVESKETFVSDWKISWIAACAILRTSIDLFKVDKKLCLNKKIREEIGREWDAIAENKQAHAIFWEFLRKERDNIVHHYSWAAYEVWMDEEGSAQKPRLGILDMRPEGSRTVLMMRSGKYEGEDSLKLLKESADWIQERIFAAIKRADFDPEEYRNLVTFKKRNPIDASLIIGTET
ncbi:hypothetical protein [uncultured Sulfitobacter sp.]|uniref:hypothetical protein n=1 Tax=uncultured Sulfitobacter sp. TaxID=191468 RepID=UPI00261AB681|nr:hypothetical protein [uncultured Sulfitobacter sp.]